MNELTAHSSGAISSMVRWTSSWWLMRVPPPSNEDASVFEDTAAINLDRGIEHIGIHMPLGLDLSAEGDVGPNADVAWAGDPFMFERLPGEAGAGMRAHADLRDIVRS